MRFLAFLSFVWLGTSQMFQTVTVQPPPRIEWDQPSLTFYTGQTMNVSWTGDAFLDTDKVKLTYPGTGGTRTLTSGVLFNTSAYAVRLADASNMVANNVPVTATLATNASVLLASTDLISVVQSKVTGIVPQDGTKILGGGQNTVCDDRNLTVAWRGLGEAQFGTATVSVVRTGGGGGSTLIPAVTFPASGNNTVNLLCARSYNPSTFFSYAFSISVIEPGGSAYTGTSATFNFAAAPSPTPTSSPTPTGTPSGTPSPSNTPTPSKTPSGTGTPTKTPTSSPSNTPSPSQTPTPSPTPSPTSAASVDYVAIGKAAAAQVDTTTPAIIGAISGIIGVGIIILGVKWYQSRQLHQKRMRRLAMTNTIVKDINTLYGHQPDMRTIVYTQRKSFKPTGV